MLRPDRRRADEHLPSHERDEERFPRRDQGRDGHVADCAGAIFTLMGTASATESCCSRCSVSQSVSPRHVGKHLEENAVRLAAAEERGNVRVLAVAVGEAHRSRTPTSPRPPSGNVWIASGHGDLLLVEQRRGGCERSALERIGEAF